MVGVQLTDVVEAATASSSANRTFFPLVMNYRAYGRPGSRNAKPAGFSRIRTSNMMRDKGMLRFLGTRGSLGRQGPPARRCHNSVSGGNDT